MSQGVRDLAAEREAGYWSIPARALNKRVGRKMGGVRDLSETERRDPKPVTKFVDEGWADFLPFHHPSGAEVQERLAADLDAAFSSVHQSEPVTLPRQRAGKLSWRAAMRSEHDPNETRIFEKVERRAVGPKDSLSLVLVLDRSWSYIRSFSRSLSAAHLLTESLDRTGNRSAVILFSDESRLVKSFNDGNEWGDCPTGWLSTRFEPALTAVSTLLSGVEGRRCLVTLTDGEAAEEQPFVEKWFAEYHAGGAFSLGLRYDPNPKSLGEQMLVQLHEPEGLSVAVKQFLQKVTA